VGGWGVAIAGDSWKIVLPTRVSVREMALVLVFLRWHTNFALIEFSRRLY